MCSIPGLPTAGSQLPVLIKKVNLKSSLVELWVSVDDGRERIYEQKREEIQIPQRKFYGSEGKPGDTCLVCVRDTWHRAQIVSIQNETYYVFLIDQGEPHVTTSAALAWGKNDSFLFPPEIELCILANVISLQNEWPETVTKFLMCLPGKSFKGLVQYVMPDRIILLEIPIISKHMCKLGAAKKIKADAFIEVVQKHLCKGGESSGSLCLPQELELDVGRQLPHHDQYFYPELTTGLLETVNVTAVIDPLNISCMLFIFSKAVKLLSDQIHQHYEESSDFGEAQPQSCGDPCATRGADGRWHRSLLKQNTVTGEDVVEVFHVDEGKPELVKAEDIRPLLGKFLKMPVFTYHCSLSGVEANCRGWTADETDEVKSMLLDKSLLARIDDHNKPQDVYYVSLYGVNGKCINDIILEKAGLVSPSESGLDLNDQKESSSFCLSLEEQKLLNLQYQTNGGHGLQEKTRPDATEQVDNDGGGCSQVPDPLLHSDGHLSTSLVQNACDASTFAVGETVEVQISCIESLQNFWCQPSESSDSLRGLMQNLQIFYASANPQSVVESICVARNPENQMWYRAKIIVSHDSSTVYVRFIDYGQTQKVPVQDVRPIDPAFLELSAQAVPCCLFNLKDDSIPNTWNDAALMEFQKFMDLSASSNTGLKCVVKAVTSDEDGLPLNMVDIQMESESLCKLLAQKCAQSQEQTPPEVPSNGYSYSTYDVEVDGKEDVFVTFSETVSNFYCQLQRNSHVYDKLMENIAEVLDQSKSSERPLELDSVCIARYTDAQWYRGQIVEVSPKPKVQFVDYGNDLAVLETDICPIPPDANLVRSVPVQAVPLGLFDMPADIPQGVNQWFADLVDGHSFIISVMEKEENGKLIVEMFDGSQNVNTMVREKVKEMKQTKMTCMTLNSDQQLSNSSKDDLPNGECSLQDERESVLKTTEQKSHSSNIHNVSSPQMEQVMILDERKPNLDCENKETFNQSSKTKAEFPPLSTGPCQKQNGITYSYEWPSVTQNTTAEVYASCIVAPDYFWCQYANTEDLNTIAKLAEEAGHSQKDVISYEMLKPGGLCLALFSQDNQWYRAQVVQKEEETLHVLFVDYGNEADVDIKNVRPLPKHLLESTPQAFLCCLSGFAESKGSWDDTAFDEFYNLLFNMPLKVTVFTKKDHPDIAVPQFSVELEHEGVNVNTGMLKYWKPVTEKCAKVENFQTVDSVQGGEVQPNPVDLCVRNKAVKKIDMFIDPMKSNGKTETVYASCIAEPSFFWCQFANTEDLDKVSQLAQEAGHEEQDMMIPQSLNIGGPCLALFSQDHQWYRAQILQKEEETLHVLFVDYGNEADVDVKNVKPLPQSLLETTPQAFLCSLSGFDESKGSWVDDAYDDFYNLLINKPLKLTINSMRDHPEIAVSQYSVDVDHEGVNINAVMLKYWKPVDSIQGGQEQCNMKQLCESKEAFNKMALFKDLMISRKMTETVYASCIAEPDFFWCQFSNTDNLHKVSQLAQEVGQEDQDVMFPQSLESGSPCLALFSQDNQWYRAQVIQREGESLHVLFVDYGNEAEVDIKNVRPLPKCLLETSPQAFLCRLSGFDESKGSWDDASYDEFYKLLVDKPLKVTVLDMEEHSEAEIPRYGVQMECEGVVVNTLMKKYWKPLDMEGTLASCLEAVAQDEAQVIHTS